MGDSRLSAPSSGQWALPLPALLCALAALCLVLQACGEDSSREARPPTILPQQSPYNLGPKPMLGATEEDELALQQERTFTIQLANDGDELLKITAARVLGDARCSFSQPAILRGEAQPRGKSAVLLLG